jgi:DNA-binding XRE family transcriptional regulator
VSSSLPRGGTSGKSVAPRKTLYKDKEPPALWKGFLRDLKKYREAAGISAQEAADALGVSPAKIYIWENGKSTPHPHDLCVYLAMLGVKRFTIE